MKNLLKIKRRGFPARLAGSVEQLLFPLRCPVCDDAAPYGENICPECIGRLAPLVPPYCMKCGKKLWGEGEFCGDCRRKEHVFARGRALYEYENIASVIYRFKYGNRREYADFLGEELAFYLGVFIRETGAEALIPIPLHTRRRRARGYNQAALLAEALGRHLELPVAEHYLTRVRDTIPCKYLNPKERQNNLKKAFNIPRNDVKLKRVLVVDDIYTTGSTIDEAAETLLAGGVEEVYFVTLACGAGV